MDTDFPPDEEYDRQCGEIFLTVKGELLIHCTLCETRYKGFQQYAEHVKVHCTQNDADYFGIEEFLILADKGNDDSFRDYNGLRDKDAKIEMGYISANAQNEKTAEMLESAEFQMQSDISDDFFWKTEEDENLLSNIEDKSAIEPFKYRFNASRTRKITPTNRATKKDRTYLCSHCDYSCNDKSNLVAHMNRHSAYKPHHCESCAKTFYTRSELQTHTRSHTGERPYLCPECGQGFITSSKLSLHIKRHKKNRDKECTFCDMKFYTYAALKVHIAVHNTERSFSCAICKVNFKLERTLKNHIKVHDINHEYNCDLCPATFNQKCNLNAHKKELHETVVKKNESNFTDKKTEDEEFF